VRPRAPGNCLTKCLCRPCSLRSNLRLCRPRPNPQMKDPSVRSPPVSWIAAPPIALGCYCFFNLLCFAQLLSSICHPSAPRWSGQAGLLMWHRLSPSPLRTFSWGFCCLILFLH
jgi:hypothetical protein